ncbi:MAG: hypothetical protein MRJ92_07395 [Nitrospira sp.]|nr:hypothetical protein [Nitrospira sp.]
MGPVQHYALHHRYAGWRHIAYILGWRSLFYLDFVLTLVIVGTLSALLYGRGFRRYARFDLVGFLLLAVLLLGLQTFAQHGQ